MTRIHFQRTGGMLRREIDADIDLNELPAYESQELLRLITETNFFKIPQNMVAPAAHDEYEYTVTVEAANTHHTIHTSDSSAPESVHLLLEKLSGLAQGANSSTSED